MLAIPARPANRQFLKHGVIAGFEQFYDVTQSYQTAFHKIERFSSVRPSPDLIRGFVAGIHVVLAQSRRKDIGGPGQVRP